MSSKFRKDRVKRNYTVRMFLKRCLGFGLISLILIFAMSSLIAFYLFIDYEVQQSIEISYMKTMKIRSKTLASIKMNELEDHGTNLSSYATLLSNLASDPEQFAEQDYLDAYASFLRQGPDLGKCHTTDCEKESTGRKYDIDFFGDIKQNGFAQELWSDVQK